MEAHTVKEAPIPSALSVNPERLCRMLLQISSSPGAKFVREGKTVYYNIADDDIKRVIAVLFEIFCKGEGRERKNPRSWR